MVYIHTVVYDNDYEIEVKVWNLYKAKKTFTVKIVKRIVQREYNNISNVGILALKIQGYYWIIYQTRQYFNHKRQHQAKDYLKKSIIV